jgi:hypothetical protein
MNRLSVGGGDNLCPHAENFLLCLNCQQIYCGKCHEVLHRKRLSEQNGSVVLCPNCGEGNHLEINPKYSVKLTLMRPGKV